MKIKIKKLLDLILILLVTSTIQSCLKNPSSKLHSEDKATDKEGDLSNITYQYINSINAICQYKCYVHSSLTPVTTGDSTAFSREDSTESDTSTSSDLEEFRISEDSWWESHCDRYILNAPSADNKKTLSSGNASVTIDKIISLVNLSLNPDTKKQCSISPKTDIATTAINKLTFDLISSISTEENLDDGCTIYKDKNNNKILLSTSENTFIVKGSKKTYEEAIQYCSKFEGILITKSIYTQYATQIKKLDFEKDDCVWVNAGESPSKKCYRSNGSLIVQDDEEESSFLCYVDIRKKAI